MAIDAHEHTGTGDETSQITFGDIPLGFGGVLELARGTQHTILTTMEAAANAAGECAVNNETSGVNNG